MTQKLQSVRGMNDLLPAQIGAWHRVEAALREIGWAYGYQEIRTPLVEKAELFTQSIGDHTDIVEKEMYAFVDGGGAHLALRPEATASVVRACNQHGLLHNQQQRLWYMGPMFRRERPQKGRYRQFHQFGIEAFGWTGPDIDAEVIRLGAAIWRRLKVTGARLQINTLGSPLARQAYRRALQTYFAAHRERLDADSLRRLHSNPLRILDSKVAASMEVVAGAPGISAFLDAKAAAQFDGLCESLSRSGIEYEVNPRLVRGLDYYTGAVFEWVSGELGAQNAVCAGGRYDRLVENRGGRPTPAVGFAIGLERLVELVVGQDNGVDAASVAGVAAKVDVYVLDGHDAASDATQINASVVALSERLRQAGLAVIAHCGGGKLKNQMKRAHASGACLAVITGRGDNGDTALAKRLRSDRGQQEISLDALVEWCRDNLSHKSFSGD